jgi:hypothetical protein
MDNGCRVINSLVPLAEALLSYYKGNIYELTTALSNVDYCDINYSFAKKQFVKMKLFEQILRKKEGIDSALDGYLNRIYDVSEIDELARLLFNNNFYTEALGVVEQALKKGNSTTKIKRQLFRLLYDLINSKRQIV